MQRRSCSPDVRGFEAGVAGGGQPPPRCGSRSEGDLDGGQRALDLRTARVVILLVGGAARLDDARRPPDRAAVLLEAPSFRAVAAMRRASSSTATDAGVMRLIGPGSGSSRLESPGIIGVAPFCRCAGPGSGSAELSSRTRRVQPPSRRGMGFRDALVPRDRRWDLECARDVRAHRWAGPSRDRESGAVSSSGGGSSSSTGPAGRQTLSRRPCAGAVRVETRGCHG